MFRLVTRYEFLRHFAMTTDQLWMCPPYQCQPSSHQQTFQTFQHAARAAKIRALSSASTTRSRPRTTGKTEVCIITRRQRHVIDCSNRSRCCEVSWMACRKKTGCGSSSPFVSILEREICRCHCRMAYLAHILASPMACRHSNGISERACWRARSE
ncbi:hypothetical protein BD410DRAFT_428349 [Rickenella mellea]|uniref:Uncharacterized protein n=1 Tax=Rickenella mellea TaxID=50990 RepID=A0A4Y7QJK1_9AGAM|nr:hypothetical protein BD410DRAFT_428349 [Rickenella mellea]